MTRFDEARNKDITEIIRHYGIEVSKNGYFKCPFHDGDRESAAIKDNRFKCFHSGCNSSGSTIDFVSKIENVNPIEAVNLILGGNLSSINYDPSFQEYKDVENNALKNMILKNSRIVSRCEDGLKYFEDRGLLEALPLVNKDQLQIKFNEYNGYKTIVYRFIKEDFVIQKSIDKNDGKRFVRNFGKATPIIMKSYDHNKYLIVEGIEDGLTALILGYNFISLNSVQNVGKLIDLFTDNREWLNVNNVILCLDNDQGGNEGTEKLTSFFLSTGLNIRVSRYRRKMVEYNVKDLNDFYKNYIRKGSEKEC